MTLDELIPRYGDNKAQEAALKKLNDADNAAIKELMSTMDDDTYEVNGWVAKYIVSERETLDQTKLLDIIKNSGINIDGLIKTTEYIDMNVLEDALYRNEIPENIVVDMDSCRDVKEVVTLRVTKAKKKKDKEE